MKPIAALALVITLAGCGHAVNSPAPSTRAYVPKPQPSTSVPTPRPTGHAWPCTANPAACN